MRRLGLAFLVFMTSTALAQSAPADPDDAEANPDDGVGPDSARPPLVEPSDEGRSWIRGAPVERVTPNPSRDALRQFELEAFGPPRVLTGDGDDDGAPAATRAAPPIGKDDLPPAL